MHKYRLYVYDAEDRLVAPAMVIPADNDAGATEEAEKMLDGVLAELTWLIPAPAGRDRSVTALNSTGDPNENL